MERLPLLAGSGPGLLRTDAEHVDASTTLTRKKPAPVGVSFQPWRHVKAWTRGMQATRALVVTVACVASVVLLAGGSRGPLASAPIGDALVEDISRTVPTGGGDAALLQEELQQPGGADRRGVFAKWGRGIIRRGWQWQPNVAYDEADGPGRRWGPAGQVLVPFGFPGMGHRKKEASGAALGGGGGDWPRGAGGGDWPRGAAAAAAAAAMKPFGTASRPPHSIMVGRCKLDPSLKAPRFQNLREPPSCSTTLLST